MWLSSQRNPHPPEKPCPVRVGPSNTPFVADRLKDPSSLHPAGKAIRNDAGTDDGLPPKLRFRDRNSLLDLIKSCRKERNLVKARSIHADVVKKRLLVKSKNISIANALITTYAKCDALEDARALFDELPIHNVVSWNALISGYVQNRLGDEALRCFRQMKGAGVSPDEVTYTCIFKACGMVGSLELGEDVDAEMRKKGFLEKDVVLGTALVDMYAKCGLPERAQEVFELLPKRDVVSWSVLITAYVQKGLGNEALECFRQMNDAGVCPDDVTYVSVLKACGIVGSLEIGEIIDAKVRKRGVLEKDIVLGTAIMDMYCKCGALKKAREVFNQLPIRNVVSWSALIAGYAHNGLGDEALICFREMKDAGVCPNAVTYIAILKACAIMQSVEIGQDIDAEVRGQGLLEMDVVVGNALVDMHSKCGAVEKAQEVFELLPEQDVVSWNALITGYSQLGQAHVVLNMYSKMRSQLIVPNSITFIVLLNACSHAGLVDQGEKLFDEMCVVYSLTPTLEHYTCMVDLFGRAGRFDKLKALLGKFPDFSHLPLFQSILGSCIKWRNVKLGRWAFEQSIRVDDKCGAAYACMGNIYAAAGMQIEADRVEALRIKNRVCKISLD